MKFHRASILLLLLVFLVIAVLFCRWAMQDIDPFTAYKYDVDKLEEISMPMYSETNKLRKMYDTLYFDNKNGNIVEVDAGRYDGNDITGVAGNIDATGATITGLHILPRIGNSSYSYEIDSVQSQIPRPDTATQNSYQSKVYRTKSNTTDKYTVFMMPWHENTYVHIMNATTASAPTNVGTYAFTYNSSANNYDYANPAAMTGITTSRADTVSKNDTMIIDPIYNTKRKVYQLSEFVKYDISSSNLLVGVGDKEMKVYTRNGSSGQTLNTTASGEATGHGDGVEISNVSFTPQIIYDLCGQNMVLYVPNGKKTLVALINYNNEEKLDLRNVCRFNEVGLDKGEPVATSSSEDATEDEKDEKDEKDDNKSKWIDYGEFDLEDYMLKTQIIPPVCPTCPSCNYNQGGACGQCGGNGGSGTKSANGNSLAGGNVISDTANAAGNVVNNTVDAAGNAVNKTIDTAGGLAAGTVGLAGGLAAGTVGTVGDVAKGTVDAVGNVATGALGAAGNVATGALGAAGNVATGALGAAGNVATGVLGAAGNVATGAFGMVGNVLGGAQAGNNAAGTTPGMMQQQTGGPVAQSIGASGATDPYSYYGQLPAKKSNEFMPITADFSSFGR